MSLSRFSEIQKALRVPKDKRNNFGNYTYRNAEQILDKAKEHLQEGEAVLLNTEPVMVGDRFYIKATATFISGEFQMVAVDYAREGESKKGMDDAQVTGATGSYAKKYALCNLFAIGGEKDPDETNTHQSNDDLGQYRFGFGKFKGQTFAEVGKDASINYLQFLAQKSLESGKDEKEWTSKIEWIKTNL